MFLDTNVLVQARFTPAPFHVRAYQALLNSRILGESQQISRQVLREYLAVVTRPQTWSIPLTMTEALGDINRLASQFIVLEDGPLVTRELLALCRSIGFAGRQVHDANIAATMLAHGEHRLLTFNRSDFVRFEPLIEVVNP